MRNIYFFSLVCSVNAHLKCVCCFLVPWRSGAGGYCVVLGRITLPKTQLCCACWTKWREHLHCVQTEGGNTRNLPCALLHIISLCRLATQQVEVEVLMLHSTNTQLAIKQCFGKSGWEPSQTMLRTEKSPVFCVLLLFLKPEYVLKVQMRQLLK